jgi:hypothetical protein
MNWMREYDRQAGQEYQIDSARGVFSVIGISVALLLVLLIIWNIYFR